MTPQEQELQRLRAMLMSKGGDPSRGPITMESQVMAGANAPMAAPTIKPTPADPRAQDFSGQEGKIKNQRAMAAQMAGRAPTKGRTVGPYDVYMGKNIGDYAQDAASQLGGAWMANKANKADAALDEERGLAKAATLAREDEVEDRGYNLNLEKFDHTKATDQRDFDKAVENDIRDFDYQTGQDKITNSQNADSNRQSWAATEVPVFFDPTDEGPPISGVQTADGVINPINQEAIPEHYISQDAYADMTGSGKGSTGTFNEPKRFIDPYSGDEQMVTFHKGRGEYFNPVTQEWLTEEDMEGQIPEKEMTESQREAAVSNFIKNNGDTMKLMHDIESAEDTWRDNGLEAGGNPFNWFTKQTGMLGDVMRGMADAGSEGSPTADNYAAAQTTLNTISRLRAGLSQTINEVERIKEETGMNALANPDVFMEYWPRLKAKVQNDIAMANKAASPRTIQAYQRWERNKGPDDVIGGKGDFTGDSAGSKNKRGAGARVNNGGGGKRLEDYDFAAYQKLSPEDKATLDSGGSI
jgi:hypothetical protein